MQQSTWHPNNQRHLLDTLPARLQMKTHTFVFPTNQRPASEFIATAPTENLRHPHRYRCTYIIPRNRPCTGTAFPLSGFREKRPKKRP